MTREERERQRGVEVLELDDLRAVQGQSRHARQIGNADWLTMLGKTRCISRMNTSMNFWKVQYLVCADRQTVAHAATDFAFLVRQAPFAQANVQRVRQELLVVRSKVDRDGQGLFSTTKEAVSPCLAEFRAVATHGFRIDATCCDVQAELALTDAHATDAQVSETQDA